MKTVCELSYNLLQPFTNPDETPNLLRLQAYAAQWDTPLSDVSTNVLLILVSLQNNERISRQS